MAKPKYKLRSRRSYVMAANKMWKTRRKMARKKRAA